MADTSDWGTQRPILTAKFERPTDGGLFVKCANGDEWPAGVDDLKRFKFVEAMETYERFKSIMDHRMPGWEEAADGALTVVRHAVECAIFYDHMPDEDEFDDLKKIMARAEAWE